MILYLQKVCKPDIDIFEIQVPYIDGLADDLNKDGDVALPLFARGGSVPFIVKTHEDPYHDILNKWKGFFPYIKE